MTGVDLNKEGDQKQDDGKKQNKRRWWKIGREKILRKWDMTTTLKMAISHPATMEEHV